jgi:ribosomal protein S18 acetylase RimI-like enzyme
MMKISTFTGPTAIATIDKYVQKVEEKHRELTYQWMITRLPIAVCMMHANDFTGFVLISKNDYDPMEEHKMPYTIDYIWISVDSRRKGFASELLRQIRQEYQSTAFCDSPASELVFSKCGWSKKFDLPNVAVMRFP